MVLNSGLERITYDINYSQAEDVEKDGVDFLIKVRNDNDYAVKAIDFSYSVGGDVVKNVRDDSETFYAYGYVKPETEGYMYCRMHVPAGSPKDRGNIKIVSNSIGLGNEVVIVGFVHVWESGTCWEVLTTQRMLGEEIDVIGNNHQVANLKVGVHTASSI